MVSLGDNTDRLTFCLYIDNKEFYGHIKLVNKLFFIEIVISNPI